MLPVTRREGKKRVTSMMELKRVVVSMAILVFQWDPGPFLQTFELDTILTAVETWQKWGESCDHGIVYSGALHSRESHLECRLGRLATR